MLFIISNILEYEIHKSLWIQLMLLQIYNITKQGTQVERVYYWAKHMSTGVTKYGSRMN